MADITMQQHEFQLEVVRSLAELKTGQQGIIDHLARLNGSVAKHEERFVEVRQFMSEHPANCPMREAFDELRGASKWKRRYQPWAVLVIGGALALVGKVVLLHGWELMAK